MARRGRCNEHVYQNATTRPNRQKAGQTDGWEWTDGHERRTHAKHALRTHYERHLLCDFLAFVFFSLKTVYFWYVKIRMGYVPKHERGRRVERGRERREEGEGGEHACKHACIGMDMRA